MVRNDIKNSSLLKTKFLIYAFNGRTYKITSFFYQAAFFMSLAICLVERTAAFAAWIPKKSSNVSLNMLRALMRPTA